MGRAKGWINEPIGITGVFDDYSLMLDSAVERKEKVALTIYCGECRERKTEAIGFVWRTPHGWLFEGHLNHRAATRALIHDARSAGNKKRVQPAQATRWLLLDRPHPDPSRSALVTCPTHGDFVVDSALAITSSRSPRVQKMVVRHTA